MEEDVQIVKKYINSSFKLTLPEDVLHAIENVLNRLQELEQIDKAHKDIVGELTIRNDELNKAIGKEYQLGYAQRE